MVDIPELRPERRKAEDRLSMDLAGAPSSHGAYTSVAHALKYLMRLTRLMLLSPTSVPRDPNTTMPSKDITDNQANKAGYVSVNNTQLATKAKVKEIKSEQRNQGWRQGKLWKVFTYLWEEGWSPFQVVRSAMLYSPILVRKHLSRRFSGFTEEAYPSSFVCCDVDFNCECYFFFLSDILFSWV